MEFKSFKRILYIIMFLVLLLGIVSMFSSTKLSGSFIVEQKTTQDMPTQSVPQPPPPTNLETTNFNELPPILTLEKDKRFSLDLDHQPGYVFSDNSDLFDINPSTGVIDFTPTQSGEHIAIVAAYENIGNYELKVIRFKVG